MDGGTNVVRLTTHPVAGLPMYDWPEVRDAGDALWSAIVERLRAKGIEAPDRVWRPTRPEELWAHPDLLIGETCGWQVVDQLRGRI